MSQILGLLSSMMGSVMQLGVNHAAANDTYQYGEMAADNAMTRGKKMYMDINSPGAIRQQLQDAGLSVGLLYGGGGSVGNQAAPGAQGNGATVQPMDIASMMNAVKQAELAESQKKSIDEDTRGKEIENNYKEENIIQDLTGKKLDNQSKILQNRIQTVTADIVEATKENNIRLVQKALEKEEAETRSAIAQANYDEATLNMRVKLVTDEHRQRLKQFELTSAEVKMLKEQFKVYQKWGEKLAQADYDLKVAEKELKEANKNLTNKENFKLLAIFKGAGYLAKAIVEAMDAPKGMKGKVFAEAFEQYANEMMEEIDKLGEVSEDSLLNGIPSGGGKGGGSR